MRIYALILVMICTCFANNFRLKQEKVNVVGDVLEVGIEGTTNSLETSVYKIHHANDFLTSQHNFHKLQIEDREVRAQLNYAIQNSSLTTKPQIHGKTIVNDKFSLVAFAQQPKLGQTRGDGYQKLLFPSVTTAGLYLVECRSDNYIAYTLAAITDLAIITRRDDRQLIVYSVHRKTGQPFANSSVSIFRHNKLIETRTTNHKGVAHFNVSYTPQLLITASAADDFTIDDAMFFPSIVDVKKCYIYTERPLYLPGEQVHFKGIMRLQQSGEYIVPSTNFPVSYTVKNAKGAKIASGETTARSGYFSAQIELPKETALGTCILECQGLGKTFQSEFQVEKFQKPKFKVQVTAAHRAILMEEKADFTIDCSYYAGGKIDDAKVSYELYKSSFHQPLFSEVGLDQFYSKNEFRSFKPQLVKNGNATLKDGKLSLSFPTEKDELSYNYRLQVSVRDASRNTASGSGSIKVERYPTKFDMKTSKQLYALEEQIVVTVKAVDINSQPVAVPFVVEATRRERMTLQGGNSEAVEKLATKTFFTATGTTDQHGVANIEIPAAIRGAVDIKVKATQSKGEVTKTVWVSEGDAPLSYSGDSILLVADKNTYRIGDIANILVVLPMKNVAPLLTVEGVDLLQFTVVPLNENSYVFKLPINEQMSPNVYFKVAAIYQNGFVESQHMIVVPPQHKILDVKVTTDQSSYRPGEKATLTIDVKDNNNKAVATDFSIAVIDESIYSLASDRNAPLHQFFYSLRRENIKSSSSIDLLSYDYSRIASRLPVPTPPETKDDKNAKMSESMMDMDVVGGGAPGDDAAEDEASDAGYEAEEALQETTVASEPAPNAQSAPRRARMVAEKKKAPAKKSEAQKENTRTLFKTTAAWFGSVTTNEHGTAQVSFDFPDNLTNWRIVVRAIDRNTRVGHLEQQTSTRKPVMVSLTHPRFFVVGDKGHISIQARNATQNAQQLQLGIKSSTHLQISELEKQASEVSVGEWLRKDVSFVAKHSGMASIQSQVTAKEHSDVKAENIKVLAHGIVKNYGYSGRLQAKANHSFKLPENTNLSESKIVVRVLPGYLAAIQESTHMLLEYPYGCAEQTMSRFMPNIVASEILQKIQSKVDVTTLQKNVDAGITRLAQLQNQDGGWGWWRNGETSQPMLSAYVALGLVQAKSLDYAINTQVLERAMKFLQSTLANGNTNYATQAYIAYALSCAKQLPQGMLDKIFDQDERLKTDSYTLSLLTLAFVRENRSAEAKVLVQEILTRAKLAGDSLPFWGNAQAVSWDKNAIEVTAMVVRALIAVDKSHKMISPALEWLMSQRKDRGWNSTKDTAEVVLTLCSYLSSRGVEANTATQVTLEMNGATTSVDVSSKGITHVFTDLENANTLQLSCANEADHLYYTAYIEYFTEEENIASATNGIGVKRSYFTLHKSDTENAYERKVLDGEVSPDDLIMVELELSCDKTREFVMLEDYIPASAIVVTKDRLMQVVGVEDATYTHREFHDEKTLFFFTRLTQGTHKVHYFFRPSIRGEYHALPAIGSLMYYPEVRGNSQESVFTVK